MRATKIVATLGPASDRYIADLVNQGVDVFRINFSHGRPEDHADRVRATREAARAAGRYVAILCDLQGPKIRVRGFGGGDVELETGAAFAIDADLAEDEGDATRVGTTYESLAREVEPGDVLVLGDGLIELEVLRVSGRCAECRVAIGGTLGPGKGINKRGGGLSAPALTEKDRADIVRAAEWEADYVAVSFPRSAADLVEARGLLEAAGSRCGIVAKVERAEAVADPTVLDEIILASDAVMVARGDLGIEIGDAALMGMQKHLIARSRALDRSVITATQMMESMITNSRPTRAEIMDVANAVLDGTDAVMLSGETAVGRHPRETVSSMIEVIDGAERSAFFMQGLPIQPDTEAVNESVAVAAMRLAERLSGVRAVVCLTAVGTTPRMMSRVRSRLPIYALAGDPRTLARVALFRSVHPVAFDPGEIPYDRIEEAAIDGLRHAGAVATGDRIILTKGDHRDVQGGTNTLKILEVV